MAHSEERKERIKAGLKKFYADNPERRKEQAEQFKKTEQANPEAFAKGRQQGGIATTTGDQHPTRLKSILEASSRTVRKILKRLGKGCSRCGWSEGGCDVHHIRGRKVQDPDNHDNLTLLCPNCHRLVHERKVSPNDLIPLTRYIGDDWKQHYYGEAAS